LAEHSGQGSKGRRKTVDDPANVEAEVKLVDWAHPRARIGGVQRVNAAGILSIGHISAEDFRRSTTPPHEEHRRPIVRDPTNESMPIAARRIEPGRAVEYVDDYVGLQILPLVRSEGAAAD
jgi:hypothetical protein